MAIVVAEAGRQVVCIDSAKNKQSRRQPHTIDAAYIGQSRAARLGRAFRRERRRRIQEQCANGRPYNKVQREVTSEHRRIVPCQLCGQAAADHMVGLTVMAPTPTLAVLAPSIATQHRVAPTDCLHVPYRVTLSRVLNGRAAISPEMALRIEAWLGLARGGETRLWLAGRAKRLRRVAGRREIQDDANARSTRASREGRGRHARLTIQFCPCLLRRRERLTPSAAGRGACLQ